MNRAIPWLLCALAGCSSGGTSMDLHDAAGASMDLRDGGGTSMDLNDGGGACVSKGWAEGPFGVTGLESRCVDPACPRPVCGDNGKVYASDCAALAAGTAPTPWRTCAAPAGAFACGERFCQSGSEYCARETGALGWGRCLPLPTACTTGTPSCACVPLAQSCGQQNCSVCSVDGSGNITLSAPIA